MDVERPLSPAETQRRETLSNLGLNLDRSHELHDLLAEDLSVEAWGFEKFACIESRRTRAVASDLLLTAADAVQANLTEAALHAREYESFVGPNGRTMPGPHSTPDDMLAGIRAEGEVVGFFRAVGSSLDCLAGCITGILQLPQSIQRADAGLVAGGLQRKLSADWTTSEDQADWVERVDGQLTDHRSDPAGWLEWAIEMRNRVVHRSRQMSSWLPKTQRRSGPQLEVRTYSNPVYLIRVEPHLRRSPWLSEMEALPAAGGAADQWLTEPASSTMSGVLRKLNVLTEELSATFAACWDRPVAERSNWSNPEASWKTAAGSQWRVKLAKEFRGFAPDYYVPPLDRIHTSGRDAPRLQIAENLRNLDGD